MRWWHHERYRQLLALPVGLLGAAVPGEVLVKTLAGWDLYAIAYLLLTWLTVHSLEPAALHEMALGARRRRLTDRLLATTPEQLSQGAAATALLATVIAMPQARSLDTSPTLVLVICVVAVVSSWLILQIGFVIVYLGMYLEKGGLSFPGDEEPGLVDFIYFALSVGTTFGATDVTVTQSRIRRQVLVHGVLAFIFNTLVLAVAVTILTSYIAGP